MRQVCYVEQQYSDGPTLLHSSCVFLVTVKRENIVRVKLESKHDSQKNN